MNGKTNIERLIEVAANYGYSEEQIVLICDEIGRASYEQFAQELERMLTPEEKHTVENLNDEEKVRTEMDRLYKEKTGNDPQETVNTYLSRHVEEFVNDHSQGPQSPSV